MLWFLASLLFLIWVAIVALAMRSEYRCLVDGRALTGTPSPSWGELFRAALLPLSWVRIWGGVCGAALLLSLASESGVGLSPEGLLPLMCGLIGMGSHTSEKRALRSGIGPDGRLDPGRLSPSPEAGMLWSKGRAVLGATSAVLVFGGALWLAMTFPAGYSSWWKVAAPLIALTVVFLMGLVLSRTHLSGTWIRVVHRFHTTHVPVERVARIEGRGLRLGNGRLVPTGVDLDTDRVARFIAHARDGERTPSPRRIELDLDIPLSPFFFWTGLFVLLTPFS